MGAHETKFVFKGFTPEAEFGKFANERLVSVVNTAPFGATCTAEVELLPTGYKTSIKVASGALLFIGTSADSDLERSVQRCLGQVRSKTFKWRKDKLARKNKPREQSKEGKSDPFSQMKKKFFTG